jgi:drug/metabolite transporter (DMT)-like permease
MNRGIIYAVLASILWGIDYAIAEKVFHKYSIYTVLFCELLIGAVAMFAIDSSNIIADVKSMKTLSSVYLFALCCLIFNTALVFICKSIKGSNATVAGLVEITYPLFIILSGYLMFGGSNLTKSVAIGAAGIIFGIAVIYFGTEAVILTLLSVPVMVFALGFIAILYIKSLILPQTGPYVRTRKTYRQWEHEQWLFNEWIKEKGYQPFVQNYKNGN